MIILSLMKCFSEKENYVFFNDLFENYSWRRLLEEDLWGIFENLKHMACCANTFIGRKWQRMWIKYAHNVSNVRKLNLRHNHMDFTHLWIFLVSLGLTWEKHDYRETLVKILSLLQGTGEENPKSKRWENSTS